MKSFIHKLKKTSKPGVLVILGPTASGKTNLGVKLAAQFNGEIVSADSRQVYKGMDVGTGKDLKEYCSGRLRIKHHLIDVVAPQIEFDLAQYQKLAFKAIQEILKQKRLPIIVGGSGLYLQALVDNYKLSTVTPNSKKRAAREKLSIPELFQELRRLKPEFARRLNNSDKNNPRRLIRYLEIIERGETVKHQVADSPYDFLILGLTWPDADLRCRIEFRFLERLEKEGLVTEVKELHEAGVSWDRLKSFGLEYRFVSQYLLGELNYQEMVFKLTTAIYRFAKRQKTWFRRWEKQGRKIHWIDGEKEASRLIKKYL